MGKWDGKRQAARRASRPLGRLRRSQTAGFGRRPNRPAGRFQPSAQILVKGVGRVPCPARGWGRSMQGAGKTGPGRCTGKKQREMASLQFAGDRAPAGGGAPEGRSSAPPKPAALPPRPSCGRPPLRAPRPRGNSAKIHGYFGSRPSRRQVASRLCCSCAR